MTKKRYPPSQDSIGRVTAELYGLGWVEFKSVAKATNLCEGTVDAVVRLLKKSGRVERKTNGKKNAYLRLT